MVSVPASPPESKSRKEPTACIAKNQESTVREEASTSCATPKSSFGSTSTEKCSPIHEINAAKLYVKKLQLLVRYLIRVLLSLVTHEEHRKMSLMINTTTNRRSKRKKRSTENENFLYSYPTTKKTNS
ncbi:hypothetical protein WA026_008333 [Henosepilachna vigintioctopunctata]|uniref:Uncharacterized protein n=1 Tax=Henosepilachna vigintioctopunctata TaxID=420089 RepID=A0AAW1UIE2_9CUCU